MSPEMIAGIALGLLAGVPAGWLALSVKIKVHKASQRMKTQSRKAGNWAAAGAGAVLAVVVLAYAGLNAIGVV